MKTRLDAGDYRFIAICLALLGATVWYSVGNFYRAFPEASIDFRVDRDQAREIARSFLASRGYRTEGYRQAAQFEYDDQAKIFLEREAGLEAANRLMSSRVRLWSWSYRWFRPLHKEEFQVAVTPRGEVAGFGHLLPDDAPRPAITAAGARSLAEEFLRVRMGRDPAAMDFVDTSEVERAHRTDRTYTWKQRDFELHDATYRIELTMLGDEPGAYREYLKVPEKWSRDYQKLRSKNEAASQVDGVALLLLGIGMLVTIVLRVRRHDVPWRRAAVVGIAGMALGFLAQLNEFPLREYSYPTTGSYSSFVSQQLLQALLTALGLGGLLFVLAAGAEPLYRAAFPNQVSLGNLFSARGLRTRRFLLGAILGVTLTGIFIAYQTGFYIAAYRWGAWSPADVPYTDLLNTRFPWAYVLFGGFFPAVSEEFLFRLFAIPFLRTLTRHWLPALVLAGFIWGFGHAAYPQQPYFIRGVEVGLGGIALGAVMLRWGILPTLVWHYSVDAMYSAMLLVRSPNLYLKLSGAASAGIVVLPVMAALVLYWKRGGFESEAGLLNGDEAVAIPPEAAPEHEYARRTDGAIAAYVPLGRAVRWAAVALLAVGVACLALPTARFAAEPVFRIGAEQARQASDAFLRTQGLDPASFRHVTFPGAHWEASDAHAAKYFLERMPAERASAALGRERPLRHWVTRYFRGLDAEEISVSVHPETGRVRGVNHALPEDRPGADVAPERAREIASALASSLGYDVNSMELKESSSDKKKARRDYSLVWEARAGDPRNVGETKWRVHATVAGDAAVAAGGEWKTPETFDRERDRWNAIAICAEISTIVVSGGLVVFGLWFLIDGIRNGAVRWRAALQLALPAAVLVPFAALFTVHLIWRDYDTARPIETFQAITWMGMGMAAVVGVLLAMVAAAVVIAAVPDALDALGRAGRRIRGWDAAAALAAAIGLGLLLHQMQGLLLAAFPAQAVPAVAAPEWIASRAPALSVVAAAARTWIMNAAGLALAALLAARAKRWMVAAGALLAAGSMLPEGLRTAGELAVYLTAGLVTVAAVVAFCRWFGRHNWLAYGLVLWVAALRGGLAQLFGNHNARLEAQGWIVAAVLVASVAWALAPAARHAE